MLGKQNKKKIHILCRRIHLLINTFSVHIRILSQCKALYMFCSVRYLSGGCLENRRGGWYSSIGGVATRSVGIAGEGWERLRDRKVQCESMQIHTPQCKSMQIHADQCKSMQMHADKCQPMQVHTNPCKTIENPSRVVQINASPYR